MNFKVQRHRLTKRLRLKSQDYKTLPLLPHLTTMVLMAYLQQFLLLSTSCLAIKKKLTRHIKEQKAQFEKAEQTSEPNMTGMLDLSEQEFEIMINMLRALMDKVDNTQDQTGNVSREMEILRKNQKEMLQIKNINGNEELFDRITSRWDKAEERPLSLKITRQKL